MERICIYRESAIESVPLYMFYHFNIGCLQTSNGLVVSDSFSIWMINEYLVKSGSLKKSWNTMIKYPVNIHNILVLCPNQTDASSIPFK